MVAKIFTTAERFGSPPEPVLSGRRRLVRFTREDAETLMRMRIIPEDATTELLNGTIASAHLDLSLPPATLPP